MFTSKLVAYLREPAGNKVYESSLTEPKPGQSYRHNIKPKHWLKDAKMPHRAEGKRNNWVVILCGASPFTTSSIVNLDE